VFTPDAPGATGAMGNAVAGVPDGSAISGDDEDGTIDQKPYNWMSRARVFGPQTPSTVSGGLSS
jgi:hypothetical protein